MSQRLNSLLILVIFIGSHAFAVSCQVACSQPAVSLSEQVKAYMPSCHKKNQEQKASQKSPENTCKMDLCFSSIKAEIYTHNVNVIHEVDSGSYNVNTASVLKRPHLSSKLPFQNFRSKAIPSLGLYIILQSFLIQQYLF